MCIIPSRIEFDELEAQERRFETELETKLASMPEPERKAKMEQMLKFSTLRFAGIMTMIPPH